MTKSVAIEKNENEIEFIQLLAQVKPEDMAEILRELRAVASGCASSPAVTA